VVGDHGEEFGEHGGTAHARTCFAESVHVPIVLKLPGKPAARVDTPAALVDLVPTLLEHTGLPRPADDALDGVSLRLVHEAPERLPKERPRFCSVLSQKATQGDFFRRAVRAGKWLYTKEVRGGGEAALYDTEADPRERAPLSLDGERAEVAARLDRWLALSLTGNLASVPLTGE
jgi:arylsulfatase A-like enzyme